MNARLMKRAHPSRGIGRVIAGSALLLVCVRCTSPAVSTAESAPHSSRATPGLGSSIAALRVIVDSTIGAGVPGAQVCVRQKEELWCHAAGVASLETGDAMQLRHRVRTASITKMLTYATAMELVKAGLLRLDDRAIDLLPAGTLDGIPHSQDIRVAQLLEHTSGLHNYNGERGADFFATLFEDPLRGSRMWTPSELVGFAKKPGNAPTGRPGEKRSYTSTGYSVLELVLEHRSGKSLSQLYREYLFVPLGMQSAGIEGRDFPGDSIVDSYARPPAAGRPPHSPFGRRNAVRADGLVNLSDGLLHYNAWAGAGGAVSANATDLMRFMDAVLRNERVVLTDQEGQLLRARSRPGATFSWNGGSWGIQASIVAEPGRDVTVVVLTNASNVGIGSHDLATRLLQETRPH